MTTQPGSPSPTPQRRFEFREALTALRRLLANPDDTEQAFRVVRALDGGSLAWVLERMKRDTHGAELLSRRPSLLAAMSDTDALAAMPEGSLGRAYLAFCAREGIAAGGLVEASESTNADIVDPELRFVADRMRDSHDLWHVVTGHRTDLAGELSVLAFTAAQTHGPGVSLLVLGGYLHSFHLWGEVGAQGRRMTREALARGRRAEFFPSAPWENLLARPLEEVRLELGISSVPVYQPFYRRDFQDALAA